LKAERARRKITQEALAEILDIPVQHVSRIETGQNIALDTLERFAIALGIRVRVEFDDNPLGQQKPPPSRKQRALARKRRGR
jgi:transcriptional regulator with XRE-family HTH domain